MIKLELNTKNFILDKINDFRNKVAYGEHKNNLRMDQASNMRLMVKFYLVLYSHDVRILIIFFWLFSRNYKELGWWFEPHRRASCIKTTITRL